MTLKLTLWVSALLFVATVWNVISAYAGMSDVNVQDRFQTIGLLENDEVAEFTLPLQKPLNVKEVAFKD